MVKSVFIIFIVIRPLLDFFTDENVLGGVNSASIATSLTACLCGISLVFHLKNIIQNKLLNWFNFFFLLFFLSAAISLINSPGQDQGRLLSEIVRLLVIFIFFNYVMISFRKEKSFHLLLGGIFLSSLIPLAMGFYQIIFNCGNLETIGFNRIYGPFVHPNVMAQYLLAISFLVLFLLFTYPLNKLKKYTLALFLVLVLFEIYHTYTRTVWVALVVGILVFIFIRTKQSKKIRFGFLFFFIFCLTLPFVAERWMDIFGKNKDIPVSSWDWRMSLWKKMIEPVKEHPFIGFGYGMFDCGVGFGAHNDYLRILYETGLFGLTSYLIILISFVLVSINGIIRSRQHPEYNKFKLIISLILAILLIGYGDNLLRNTVVVFYYFCSIALVLNSPNPQLSRSQHEQNTLS